MCAQQELSTSWSNSQTIKSLKNFLLTNFSNPSNSWESTSQDEYILTAFRNLSISPPLQEDLEISFYSSCGSFEETKESWNNFDGEKPLEYNIEECIIKEDIQCDLN